MFSLNSGVVPKDLDSVTSIASEVSPSDVGLKANAADKIWASAQKLYQTGMTPGMSVCVRHKGEVIVNRAIGYAKGGRIEDPAGAEKMLLTTETPVCLFSSSKAITAMLIHYLAERGDINLLDPVSHYIPEYGCNGKENTTIKHLLSHRGGIPRVGTGFPHEMLFDHDEVMRHLCEASPISPIGRGPAYHAITSGFVFGELVQRVTGKCIRTLLDEVVCQPLGMRYFNYGVDAADVDKVALHSLTGIKPVFPMSSYIRYVLGADLHEAVEISNDPRFMQSVVPAGNIYSTAEEASKFFQVLLDGGRYKDQQIFDPMTVHRAVMGVGGPEVDRTLMVPMRYSMGFMLGSKPLGLYGPSCEQAFGHLGFVNILCWADPERDLSASILTTGKPLLGTHFLPWAKLITTIANSCPQTSGRK